jgi:glutamine synthetase
VLARPAEPGRPSFLESFVAGQLACLSDFALLFAPTLNSYKRLQPGSFAPTTVGWGRDNRTCPIRVVGEGSSLRIEHRVPGGDANPYLAVAGIVAAGLYGIENGLVPPAPVDGELTASSSGNSPEALPRSLREAVLRWRSSPLAEDAFGAAVVDHYARAAEAELAAFDAVVTDWERRRCFERT